MSHHNHGKNCGWLTFETPLGWWGLAWNERGLTRLCLPERSSASVKRRLLRVSESGGPQAVTRDAAPGWVRQLVEAIEAYAAGEQVEFDDFPIDLAGVEPFRQAIYDAARSLTFGQTVTYGELAKIAGHPGMARETGEALGKNPVPLVVPCHRIVAAGGKIGGFSAPGGSATKQKLLELEGVRVGPPAAAQASFAF